jgi:hypothetical protein
MKKRSHHVVENKGSGLGSFSKTNRKRTRSGGERTHFFVDCGELHHISKLCGGQRLEI